MNTSALVNAAGNAAANMDKMLEAYTNTEQGDTKAMMEGNMKFQVAMTGLNQTMSAISKVPEAISNHAKKVENIR